MRSGWLTCGLVGLMVTAGACTANEENIEGGSAAVETTEPVSFDVGNLTISKRTISKRIKATKIDSDNPAFDSCSAEANFWEIRGTAHDAEINKLLRGDFVEPQEGACEFPEEFSQEARLIGIDPDEGLMAITEFESYFEGGAHPSHGAEFKMVDLRSGKLLSLADYVKPESAPKLNELVRVEIATKKIKVLIDAPSHDRGGRVKKSVWQLMPQDDQDLMKQFSDSYFTSVTDDGKVVPAKLETIHDFVFAGSGLTIDLTNQLPHALGGMDAVFKLKWSDLKAAGVLRTDTDLIERSQKARPKQPHRAGLRGTTPQ